MRPESGVPHQLHEHVWSLPSSAPLSVGTSTRHESDADTEQCKDAGGSTVAPDSEVRLPGSGVRRQQEWRLELRGPSGGAGGTWGATQCGNDGARAELLGKLQAWPASSPSHGLARDPG